MGEISDFKENNLWARFQKENQKPPDSKARVRFLLDEIALLQARFENRDHRLVTAKHGKPAEVAALKVEVPDPTEEIASPVTNSHAVEVSLAEEETPQFNSGSSSPVRRGDEREAVSRITHDNFAQIVEQKLGILLTDRVDFYERAGKELTVGKVDKSELAKLLQLEKTKLRNHRAKLDELHQTLSSLSGTSDISTHGRAIYEKLGQLLTERENFHLKFEVQVELGHFFRLLKLLESQKAKHETFRREVENMIQLLKEAVEQEVCRSSEEAGGSEKDVSDAIDQSISNEECDVDRQSLEDEKQILCSKEAKAEMLRLFYEQEQHWKKRQQFVEELERRLAVAEQENRKLSDILNERHGGAYNGCDAEKFCWTRNLPEGYSSVYFSPIFHERKAGARTSLQQEAYPEVWRLKAEVSNLKLQLQQGQKDGFRGEQRPSERLEMLTEEKAISVDSSLSTDAFKSMTKGVGMDSFHPEGKENSGCIFGDRCLDKTAQNLAIWFQKNWHIFASKVKAQESPDRLCMEIFKQINVELQHGKTGCKCARIAELENQIEVLNSDMVRAAEEHTQLLENKKRALMYAQDLNLQLANDMSTTKNALAELREEYKDMTASFEAKLGEARTEAEGLVRSLREELGTLAQSLRDKEEELEATKRRMQACQRETDAAVLEKNEALAKMRSLMEELRKQEKVHQSLEDSRLSFSSMEAKLKEAEQCNCELRQDLSRLKDELGRSKDEQSSLQSKLMETEYELGQREEALERLTLHLASTIETRSVWQEKSVETLRSKFLKKQSAKKSLLQVEEQMASMVMDMSHAKQQMEEMKAFARGVRDSQPVF